MFAIQLRQVLMIPRDDALKAIRADWG